MTEPKHVGDLARGIVEQLRRRRSGVEQFGQQFSPGDAGNPLNFNNALCRNRLPAVNRLPGDAEFFAQGANATCKLDGPL
jgi:hypothetical protein